MLDAGGGISVTERAAYIARIRNLARLVAQAYYDAREKLGFPMLHKDVRMSRSAGTARERLLQSAPVAKKKARAGTK